MSVRTAAALALAGVLFAAGPALAEDLTFDLINKSSSAVTAVYLSHSGTSDWEENILGKGTRANPGETLEITVADGRDTCMYDIKILFKDETEVEDYKLDLCDLGEYTVEDE